MLRTRVDAHAGRRARSFAFLATTVIAVPVPEALEETRRQSGRLTPVIGHWTDSTMGTAALVVNGEKWSGQTSADALRGVGQQLFGAVSETFIANGTAAGAFPIAVAAEPREFRSGTLRAQFNLLGGRSDQIAGVLFGLRDTGEYFYVRFNTRDNNVAVWAFANGERRVLKHGDVHKAIGLGVWHELVVTVRGREVRAYIAGDTTISVAHTLDAEPVGRVGVWVKRDAITAFRGFVAQPN